MSRCFILFLLACSAAVCEALVQSGVTAPPASEKRDEASKGLLRKDTQSKPTAQRGDRPPSVVRARSRPVRLVVEGSGRLAKQYPVVQQPVAQQPMVQQSQVQQPMMQPMPVMQPNPYAQQLPYGAVQQVPAGYAQPAVQQVPAGYAQPAAQQVPLAQPAGALPAPAVAGSSAAAAAPPGGAAVPAAGATTTTAPDEGADDSGFLSSLVSTLFLLLLLAGIGYGCWYAYTQNPQLRAQLQGFVGMGGSARQPMAASAAPATHAHGASEHRGAPDSGSIEHGEPQAAQKPTEVRDTYRRSVLQARATGNNQSESDDDSPPTRKEPPRAAAQDTKSSPKTSPPTDKDHSKDGPAEDNVRGQASHTATSTRSTKSRFRVGGQAGN